MMAPPKPVARVYANHGRWIVQCECGNAVEATPDMRSWRCAPTPGEAWNPLAYCGASYTVLWPDHQRIAAILTLRPDPRNRNWWPGESFRQLVAENIEHGCEVPEGEVG